MSTVKMRPQVAALLPVFALLEGRTNVVHPGDVLVSVQYVALAISEQELVWICSLPAHLTNGMGGPLPRLVQCL